MENLAGRTSLPEFARGSCARCRLLVTNDTGGMHLANALGVPLLALFGPTNPLRTGPVFTAPATVLQPPGSPHRRRPLTDLAPATVAAALRELLVAQRS
jgi:heptosyltransferase-2